MSLKYIWITFFGLQVKATQLGPISRASPYLPKSETESSLRNVVFWKISRTVFLDIIIIITIGGVGLSP
jgi:hypothetical protein